MVESLVDFSDLKAAAAPRHPPAVDPAGPAAIDLSRPRLANADGSFSTEESITVTDPRLNGGQPTNIPSIWQGRRPPMGPDAPGFEGYVVNQALQSGQSFKSFGSINEAVTAARARSDRIGTIRANAQPGRRSLVDFSDLKPANAPPKGLVDFSDLLRDGTPATLPARDPGATPAPVAPPSLFDRAGDVVSDMGTGITEAPVQALGGVRDAVQEVNESAFSLATWLNENVVDLGHIDFSDGIGWKPGMSSAGELPEVDKAESVTGNLVRGVSQFLTAFLPAAKAVKVGSAATRTGQFARASGAGAIADATAFDPHEKRLGNLVQEYPALANPVTEYLAAAPGDTEVEGRFKNAIEGLGLGVAAEGFFQAVRAIRASRRAKAARTGAPGVADAPEPTLARPDALQADADDVPREVKTAERGSLSRFVQSAIEDNQAPHGFTHMADIDDVLRSRLREAAAEGDPNIAALVDIDKLTDAIIPTNNARHSWSRHGEGSKDRTPISIEDFERIPEVMLNPDSVTLSSSLSRQTASPVFVFRKRFNGDLILLEETLTGRNRLQFKTLRKRPSGGSTGPDSDTPGGGTPRLDDRTDPAPNQNIGSSAGPDKMSEHLRARTDDQIRTLAGGDLDLEARALVDAEVARRGIEMPAPREAYPQPSTASPSSVKAEPYPSQTVVNTNGKTVKWNRPLDLVSWLRSKGGLQNQGGELSGMTNAPRKAEFTANEGVLGPMVSPNGLSLDDAARAAWEEGFIDSATRPDVNQFLDVLRRTHDSPDPGVRAFRPADRDWLASRNPERAVEQDAAAMGIDGSGRSVDELGQEVSLAATLREDAPALSRTEVEASAPLQGDVMSPQGADALDAITAKGKVEGDHAGNIRLDKIHGVGDIRKILKTAADQSGGFADARRGVMSRAETQSLADEMGMTVQTLMKRRKGQAFNAEQAMAARQLLADTSQDVRDKMRLARGGSDEAKLAFMEAWTRHVAVQEQVSGITAEAGRTLGAFREVAKSERLKMDMMRQMIAQAGGPERIDTIADKLAALDDPKAFNKALREMHKASLGEQFVEAWKAGLLSGPATHATNIVGNTITALWSIPESAVSGLFGVGRNSERVFLREAPARAFGLIEGVKDGLRDFYSTLKTGNPPDPAGKAEEAMRGGAIPGKFGEAVRVPFRLLNAEDAFFKAVGYRMEINAQAVRHAARERLSGRAFAKRVVELRTAPTEDMKAAATQNARMLTYTNELGEIGRKVQAVVRYSPATQVIVPFFRTPVNLVKYAANRSALPLLTKDGRATLMGRNGKQARDEFISRITLGSMVSATAVSLAAEGHITGGGPREQGARALWLQSHQPYSVKVGDTWYSYARLEPFATLLGVAADYADISGQVDKIDQDELAARIVLGVSDNLLSKTWVRGIADLLHAVTDPRRYGGRYISRLAGSQVPSVVAAVAREVDPTMRETRGILDAVMARIPGYSKDLPPRRDVWGRPIAYGGGLGPDMASSIYMKSAKPDRTADELLRLDLPISKPKKTFRNVELTPGQYDEYSELRGRVLHKTLDTLVSSPIYQQSPDYLRRAILQEAISEVNSGVSDGFAEANPDLLMLGAKEQASAMTEGRKRKAVKQKAP